MEATWKMLKKGNGGGKKDFNKRHLSGKEEVSEMLAYVVIAKIGNKRKNVDDYKNGKNGAEDEKNSEDMNRRNGKKKNRK